MVKKLNELANSGVKIKFYDGDVFCGVLLKNFGMYQSKNPFALAWYNKKGVLEAYFTFSAKHVAQVEKYSNVKENGGQVI